MDSIKKKHSEKEKKSFEIKNVKVEMKKLRRKGGIESLRPTSK